MQITGDSGQIEGMTQETENDPAESENQNTNTIWMTYDPTRDKMSKIVLVGGMDESKKSLETFEKAWDHEDDYLRSKWRQAIKKEFENMR